MSGLGEMRHTLRFSLRRDALDLTLDQVRESVQTALGCTLTAGGERYDMFLFEGYVLGMEVLLGEWRGIGGVRTFQLHGRTPASSHADASEWRTIDIDSVVIDVLRARDAGVWRVPSDEELLAESAYTPGSDEEKLGGS
jgi:hypothetical protein